MYEGFDLFTFFLGLPLGLVIAGIVLYLSYKKGRKERRFDERYTTIHQYARSISWIVTTFTILIVWAIVIIFEGPGLAFFLMSGMWTVHMVSYGIAGAIANKKN